MLRFAQHDLTPALVSAWNADKSVRATQDSAHHTSFPKAKGRPRWRSPYFDSIYRLARCAPGSAKCGQTLFRLLSCVCTDPTHNGGLTVIFPKRKYFLKRSIIFVPTDISTFPEQAGIHTELRCFRSPLGYAEVQLVCTRRSCPDPTCSEFPQGLEQDSPG